MKKKYFIYTFILIMLQPVLSGCMQGRTTSNTINGIEAEASEQADENQQATIPASENSTPDDINRNIMESSDEPLWAQPVEEHGQLFTHLNLDGVGDYDDEAYVSLYNWDHNGFGRYDASELVVRVRFGTGDTTAHIIKVVGSYQFYTAKLFSEKKDVIVLEVNTQYANSGLVSVFALDVYGTGETDPFPSIVERLNTTGEEPILSADGEKLYTGSLIQGTTITDVDNKPLQGIVLHSSGDGYSGPIDDQESQTIYWNEDGWIAIKKQCYPSVEGNNATIFLETMASYTFESKTKWIYKD